MPKILIVDDTEAIIVLLSKILADHGFDVEAALSKKDLVLSLLSSNPDLILLDVRLSGEDGRKICRDLKANSFYKDIPVILISGSHDLLESYRDYNAEGVIEKPFDMKSIIEKITETLMKKPQPK